MLPRSIEDLCLVEEEAEAMLLVEPNVADSGTSAKATSEGLRESGCFGAA